MKIVYIYTAISTKGGADRIITFKANYLAENYNNNVYIITDSQNNLPFSFPLSPKVHHIDLGINFAIQYRYNIVFRLFVYKKFMRLYKKALSDVLHKIHPEIVISTGGRDLEFITTIDDSSIKIAEIHTIRESFRIFNLLEDKGLPYNLVAKYYRRKIENKIKYFSSLVLLSEKDALSWIKIRNSEIIPNPLPFQTDSVSNCTNKKVISIGRLSYEKGFDQLIKAWKIVNDKYSDWELNIYGEGQLKNKLLQDINDYGLVNSVHIHTPVINIAEKYIESSIYAMSSQFESFGLALAEAMNCGVPCISFNCPYGPKEIIKDNEDGFLVENGNYIELAEKVCFLIENDDIRKQMGINAKRNIQRYSPNIIMEQWIKLFNKLL